MSTKTNITIEDFQKMSKQGKAKVLDQLFMKQFRGKACERTTLKGWGGLPSAGHHILPKSVYPEHRWDKKIICVLAPHMHQRAEDHPEEFLAWLKMKKPEQYEYVMANKHHRDKPKVDPEELFIELTEKQKGK